MNTQQVPLWVIQKLSVDNNLHEIVPNKIYDYKGIRLVVDTGLITVNRRYFNDKISKWKRIRVDV